VNGQADYELVEPNYEGVRVRCLAADECGWFLLRLSLHDPVMVLNIESDVAGGTQRIENKLRTMLSAFTKLQS
jgi:phosphomannomutase